MWSLEGVDSVCGIAPNAAVLHQASVAGRNNQRAGTARTRTRGEVQGSTRKMRMQKYTGRARQGSVRAPHHVGGGTVFGPRPRSYAQALPKKMRRLAIRSALSGKVVDGELVVVDGLTFKKPKTKEIIRILQNVGIERSALIVTGAADRTVLASVRNLERTKLLSAAYLNVVDMLNHKSMLMTEEAVRVTEKLWGAQRPADGAGKDTGPRTRRPAETPAPTARRRRTKVTAAAEAMSEAAAEIAEQVAKPTEAEEARVPSPRTRRRATVTPTEDSIEDAKPARRAARNATKAPDAVSDPAAKPKRPRRPRKTETEES